MDELFNREEIFKSRRENASKEIDRIRQDYISVFSSPAGLRVFLDLIKKCYLFTPYQQQNAGAYLMEGKRELGLYLLGCVGFTEDPNSLLRLVKMFQAGLKK